MLPVYPHPKCRFGSNSKIVDATYVMCTQSPTPVKDREAKSKEKVNPSTIALFSNNRMRLASSAWIHHPVRKEK
jgi:hypothetical protein